MKIASHNSFTYLRPRRWYMRPFAFMARCQRVSWGRQLVGFDVRLFDLRVRFDKKTGEPYFCHGFMRYEGNVYVVLNALAEVSVNINTDIFIRVVLEDKKPTQWEEALFYDFCEYVEYVGGRVHAFGGNDRSDWDCKHPHYNFKTPLQNLNDKYSSTTTLFPKGLKWLRFLDDLCPVLYARLHNRRNIERGTSHEWLFIDFVDIQ